jgi:tRNA pseudouridine32 synthase/23S rRNA pseudouridine746 synthase
VHRIDRDTAGLVLLAVQPHTRDAYQALFRARAVHKHYEAVAAHRPDLALPRRHASRLEPDPERFFIGREVPGEPNSVSELACAQVLGRHALYHLRSITGQRHQLRLHMAALGRPILGDAFYPRCATPPAWTTGSGRCSCWRAPWPSPTPSRGRRARSSPACNWPPRRPLAAGGRMIRPRPMD